MEFVFVYQREPHARQMAFADVPQAADLGERVRLAAKTCEEYSLDRSRIWVDGMDDQSRALFGDLPHPVMILDPTGVIRCKLPWAEPEEIGPRLRNLLAGTGKELRAILEDPDPHAPSERARLAAEVWAHRHGRAVAVTGARPATLWAAAAGTLPADARLRNDDAWLGRVAAATLAVELPRDPRWRGWIDRLLRADSVPIRHWALQRLAEHSRECGDAEAGQKADSSLEAMRRADPWLRACTKSGRGRR